MQKLLFFIATVFVIIGSVFLIVSQDPEQRIITSDDGRVILQGEFLSSDHVSIGTVPVAPGASFTAVLPPIYQFYPAGKILTQPTTLTINYDSSITDIDSTRLRIAYYDDDFGMWRSMDTNVDVVKQQASTTIRHLSKWALLLLDDIARPNFDQEISAMVDASPAGAIGYQMEIGYADVPGDFVILDGAGKSGGCGGQYRTGISTQMTSKGSVFGDHLEYQTVALWQIGDGCEAKRPIE